MWVVFNIEVFNASQMPFWSSIFFGCINMCSAMFPPFTMKASPKTACHNIQWLQFVNRNIVGLQYCHSSRHFQIPITLAISTLQLGFNAHRNFGLASTTICERGFSKFNWVKSDCRSRLKHWIHSCECHHALFQ